ncbi:MAG: ABC transporter ATP-binding protein [Desulfobacteraceae bacterium]
MDENRSQPLMRLRSVSKGFNTKEEKIEILNQVDFDIYKGQTIAVVGASGIGKSTFLHVIGTLDRPDSGSLFFQDCDLLSMNDEKLARFRNKKIGFVFQFHHLLSGFTALENVMIPCMISRIPRKQAMEKAKTVITRLGLEKRLDHRAEDLSGGEQQRIAMARALVMNPDLLLADEPTGNLDRKNSSEMHRLIMDLNQEFGMTLVVVTHNEDLAALMQKKVTIKETRIISVD